MDEALTRSIQPIRKIEERTHVIGMSQPESLMRFFPGSVEDSCAISALAAARKTSIPAGTEWPDQDTGGDHDHSLVLAGCHQDELCVARHTLATRKATLTCIQSWTSVAIPIQKMLMKCDSSGCTLDPDLRKLGRMCVLVKLTDRHSVTRFFAL